MRHGIKFKREEFDFAAMEEALPLFVAHFNEVSANKDIELNPNYEKYNLLNSLGYIRYYTARDEFNGNKLVGYAVYLVDYNLHYKQSLQANQDVVFIDPKERGFGKDFLPWCDEMLKSDGVQIVYQHVKVYLDWSSLLERIGYKKVEYIFSRRFF